MDFTSSLRYADASRAAVFLLCDAHSEIGRYLWNARGCGLLILHLDTWRLYLLVDAL